MPSARKIGAHHALRGIAAIAVTVSHMRDITLNRGISLDSYTSLIAKGYLWVDLFFVLSGFVLSYVYEPRLQQCTGGYRLVSTIWSFLKARFFRIYPLHIVTLLFTLVVIYLINFKSLHTYPDWTGDFSMSSFLSNLVLVHGWGLYDHPTWNGPSWSISAEAFAYLIFPMIAASAVLVLWKQNVFLLGLAAVLYCWVFSVNSSLNVTSDLGLVRCLAGFLLGVFVYRWWNHSPPLRRSALSILQVMAVLGLAAIFHFDMHDALAIPLFCLLIYLTADDAGWLGRLLNWRPLIYLGLISYSIYMVHFSVQKLFRAYQSDILGELASLYDPTKIGILVLLGVSAATIAVSIITYLLVELPGRRCGHGMVKPAQ